MTAIEPHRPATAADLWDAQQKKLIKEQIAPKATDDELRLFAQVCARTGLDPFQRQIFCLHRYDKQSGGNKMSIQTSIDGLRVIAERSGKFEGTTQAEWCGPDGKWVDVWLAKEPPAAARIGVWRTGFREPLVRVALWGEYAQKKKDGGLMGLWGSMPALMLAKCAEALALRAAFPNDLSGLYTTDEMGQADNVATPVTSRGAPVAPSGNGGERHSQPSLSTGAPQPTSGGGSDAQAIDEATSTKRDSPAGSPVAPPPVEVESQPRLAFPPPGQPTAAEPAPEPVDESEDLDAPTLREAQQSARRMREQHAAPPAEPAPPAEGQVSADAMSALRDLLETAKRSATVRDELVEKWKAAGLPNVSAPNVTLTEEQYAVALPLAQDAAADVEAFEAGAAS